jgi:hypothetical protein
VTFDFVDRRHFQRYLGAFDTRAHSQLRVDAKGRKRRTTTTTNKKKEKRRRAKLAKATMTHLIYCCCVAWHGVV